jgi:galactose mutarotase-like enzyme
MIYQITSGNSVAKVSTKGGELVSFINNNVEYVWGGDPKYWSGQAPVLFPTVGSLINRETEINGIIYQMKKHGFARKSEFELINQTEDSICFSLKSNKDTLLCYPFEFELRVIHTVFKFGFKTEYKVINNDKTDILFGIGGHTGFNCPLFENTQFTDYSIIFEQTETGPVYYTRTNDCDGVIHREDRVAKLEGNKELKLEYSLFDRDVIIIDNIRSHFIKLVNKENGKGFEFKMNGFKSLGLWTPPFKKAPFICIEPWTVSPDFSDNSGKFIEKPYITKLPIGCEFSVSYEMKTI